MLTSVRVYFVRVYFVHVFSETSFCAPFGAFALSRGFFGTGVETGPVLKRSRIETEAGVESEAGVDSETILKRKRG